MTTASKGRLFALALLLIAGVVIGVAVFSGKKEPRSASAMDPAFDAPPPLDPSDTGVAHNPQSLQDVIAGGAKGAWTSTREDGSVAMRILSERLDPKPEGRFELSAVASWFYSPSNRVRVTASRADLLWPSQDKTPESGRLAALELALFPAATPDRPDEDPGEPTLTGSLDSLEFDSAMSQLRSPDTLRVKGQGITLEAHGFLVRLNEVNRQVTYLRIDASPQNHLILGERQDPPPETATAAAPASPTSTPNAAVPSSRPPQIDHYALTLGGPVQIRQGERILTGERVTLLLRLTDGKLSDSAIGSLELPEPTKADGENQDSAGAPDKKKALAAAPTMITWAGPAELNLIDAPPELARDDVYARLDATERDPVTFADAGLGVAMRCGRAEYFATTRRITLEAHGPVPAVGFKTGKGLTFDTRRLALDLSRLPDISGVATGPARASSQESGGKSPAETSVAWDGESIFILRATGDEFVPTSVALKGAIKATSRDGTATADALDATFETGSERTGEIDLRSLNLSGNAQLASADSKRIGADRIEMSFAASEKGPVPTFAIAIGHVTGQSEDGELRSAGRLVVTFATGADARATPQLIDASGDVVLRSRKLGGRGISPDDYVELHADQLSGDLHTQLFDLSGGPATIARVSPLDRGSVTGGTMRIDGSTRRLSVFGPGTATRSLRRNDSDVDRLSVQWTTSMYFDDRAGHADCKGGIVATGEFRGTDRHMIRGDTLALDLTPGDSNFASRELLSATVQGSMFDPKAGTHARAESRRFVQSSVAAGSPRLEALLSIESQSLAVRPLDRSVEAPGPGRIVIEDRREQQQPRDATPDDVLVLGAATVPPRTGNAITTRGTTIFTWQGGVRVDGPANTATMHSGVRVRHKPSGARDIVDMECERLDASFEPDPEDLANPRPREIVASGAIFVRRGDLQLVGDRVRFVVGTNELVIEAEPGNLVSIDDASRGARATAEAVRLDTKTGAWNEIRRGSVTLPR